MNLTTGTENFGNFPTICFHRESLQIYLRIVRNLPNRGFSPGNNRNNLLTKLILNLTPNVLVLPGASHLCISVVRVACAANALQFFLPICDDPISPVFRKLSAIATENQINYKQISTYRAYKKT
jgi:hypothetical protein